MRLPVRRPPHPAHLVPAATSRKALRPSRRRDGEDYGAGSCYGGDRSLVGRDYGAGSGGWRICLRGLAADCQQVDAAKRSALPCHPGRSEAKSRDGTGRPFSTDASGQTAGLNRKTGGPGRVVARTRNPRCRHSSPGSPLRVVREGGKHGACRPRSPPGFRRGSSGMTSDCDRRWVPLGGRIQVAARLFCWRGTGVPTLRFQ